VTFPGFQSHTDGLVTGLAEGHLTSKNMLIICKDSYWEQVKTMKTAPANAEMWANAQRDGRPAEHRWRPLFNAAKFG